MDSNATTPLADEVLEEIIYALKYAWGNPSSCYENGILARNLIEKARQQVAKMINAQANAINYFNQQHKISNAKRDVEKSTNTLLQQGEQPDFTSSLPQSMDNSTTDDFNIINYHNNNSEISNNIDNNNNNNIGINDENNNNNDSNNNNKNNDEEYSPITKITKLTKSASDNPSQPLSQPSLRHQHQQQQQQKTTLHSTPQSLHHPETPHAQPHAAEQIKLNPPLSVQTQQMGHFQQQLQGQPRLPNELGIGEKSAPLPHIVSSNLEHDSIKLVMQHYNEIGLAEITFIKTSTKTGCVDVEELFSTITDNTCLVTIMLANNESGIIQPIREIAGRLSRLNEIRSKNHLPHILLHTDAAQAIGKVEVDVDELGVDFLTIVGHKFYGPRIGALYSRGCIISPLFFGGGQEKNFRPGTENTGMIAGLGKACELVTENLKTYYQHMKNIRDYLEAKLEESFPGRIRINGKNEFSERLPNTCNVSILGHGLKGHVVLSKVKRLVASVGAACHSNNSDRPSPILLSMGIPEEVAINALRLSVGRWTSFSDVDEVVEDLVEVVKSIDLCH